VNSIDKNIRRLSMALVAAAMSAIFALVGVSAASAGTVNPVISSASYTLGQSDFGPYELASVHGYSFTPQGTVYTEFQDITTDPGNTVQFASGYVTANMYGQISNTRFLDRGTAHLCHWLRAWAWDYGKTVWSSQAFFAHGPGC
jgi:hypothetical protein